MTEVKFMSRSVRAAGVSILKSVLSVAACSMFFVGSAAARDEMPEEHDEEIGTRIGPYLVNANLAIVSDYISRGFTQTSSDPAVQGEFKITRGPIFVGTWASSMNLQDCDTCVHLNSEFDIYAGLKKEIIGLNFETQIMYVAYPGGDSADEPYNYWEYKFGVDRDFTDYLNLGVALHYSPNYSLDTGANWVYEFNGELKLPKVAIFSPAISGEISYQDGNIDRGGIEYWYWDAGLELGFAKHFKIDLRYHDTLDVDETDCAGQCGPRFVAALKGEF
jgi:uncharacterized protein (TIGR02001 family)